MYFNIKVKRIAILIVFVLINLVLAFSLFFNKNFVLVNSEQKNGDDGGVALPIIMYHSVLKSKKSLGKFVISPEEFESDLKYLKENNYTTVVVQDLVDYTQNNKELPEKPIMLTFDDGYYNNYLYAFPLLKKYESKIVLAPIGVEVDRYSDTGDKNPNYAHITWDDAKEMMDSGLVEIQNHSYNMHKMSKKRRGTKKNKGESIENYKKLFVSDIETMQNKVEEHLGIVPNTFVFPFGAISNCSIEILKQMGFQATFNCENKINFIKKSADDLYGLCRFLRPSGISSETFFDKVFKKLPK